MPISSNFTSILTKEFEINFTQCIPNGSMKYTELCQILQVCAALHSELGGISFSDMQIFNQAWVLSRMRVEILELPKWKDTISVKTWIVSLENSRCVRAMEVYLNSKKIISSETFWVVMNTKSRRAEPLAIPHEHFEKYPTNFATQQRVSKIEFDDIDGLSNTRKIVFSDLDIVNHANSVKYLEWCLDCLDENIIIDQKLMSLEMNYLKELSLRDDITIKTGEKVNGAIFSISKDDNICFVMKLKFKKL